MAALRAEGKVRNIGASNFDVPQMNRAQAIAPIASLQPRYSLIRREIEPEILPFVTRENIGVIAYSPMASGLLTGGMTRERVAGLPADNWRYGHEDFREPQLSRHQKLVSLLRDIGQRHGRSPATAARSSRDAIARQGWQCRSRSRICASRWRKPSTQPCRCRS
jgi:aryl-alcohol dehydrogenase-like predicted oxidoreductase